MVVDKQDKFTTALQHFRLARRKAALEQIVSRLMGRSADLLSYEEVREKLKVQGSGKREMRYIDIDAIVGSVGRYSDFTRSFLPRLDSTEERWTRVRMAQMGLESLPPIDVYQIGEVYFVLDGNHRVSIAHQLGMKELPAYVTEVCTKVSISPDTSPDDLIWKAEYVDFLERTHLDELRPEADLSVSVPGQYQLLEEDIRVYQYLMDIEKSEDVPYEEAVAYWYDQVYTPVIQAIRAQGILKEFQHRTETDLYLWIRKHRKTLEERLGWELDPQSIVSTLAAEYSPKPQRVAARLTEKIKDAVIPDELEAGPTPGSWRKERVSIRVKNQLFADILVAINGKEIGWQALRQAVLVAQREKGTVHGLHVVRSKDELENISKEALRDEFNRYVEEAGVSGRLAFETGKVPRKICGRSRWNDLVVLSLSYPPEPKSRARLGSGLSTILRRCPRPVMTVPGISSRMSHALLAYDGSTKANEALFTAAYISGKWGIPLTVITVIERGRTASETLVRAQTYLNERGVRADCIEKKGQVGEEIIQSADEHECDFIIMGGYGLSPVFEVVIGSAVDMVLRVSRKPLLICR